MMLWTQVVLWTVLGFFLGAMPFSVWLGRFLGSLDLPALGDGNPGAANAWRVGGWRIGFPVLALDYLKAALPVGIAYQTGSVSGWSLFPVALAPILGHVWSPFLQFRGGKGVNVSFGVWSGLTLWQGPTLLGILLALCYGVQQNDGWSVALGMAGFLGCLVFAYGDPVLSSIGAANMLVLAWTHRRELNHPPRLRSWLTGDRGRTR
jgi:glycerol-3-phosphate acyltransferase PlsY